MNEEMRRPLGLPVPSVESSIFYSAIWKAASWNTALRVQLAMRQFPISKISTKLLIEFRSYEETTADELDETGRK